MDSDFLQYQETLLEHINQSIRTMYVAQIDSYNSSTRRATVKILGEFETDVDEYVQIPTLTDCLVGMPVGGGFFISLPVKKGDSGRLVIFSQDIDQYKSFGGINKTSSDHDFQYQNSIFIPDCNPFNVAFPAHDADNLVIGTIDGKTSITITPYKKISIKADYKVEINSADVSISDNLSVGNGASGEFGTTDGKTVTVVNGIITNIN